MADTYKKDEDIGKEEDDKLINKNGKLDQDDKIRNGDEVANKNKLAQMQEEDESPVDKWNIVYFILILHGVGTLMPWNMFITANAYFVDYKLAGNGTDVEVYRNFFLSFLGFTAQVPNVLLNAINLFCQRGGGNTRQRIIWSIIVVIVMFILTIVLAMLDSSEWPIPFFFITMVSVVIINSANGMYQNSVYGTAACLPMKYTNAVVLGSNISGTLASVLNIISIASAPDPRTAAIYYFIAAVFVLLIAFDTYFVLPLLPFYRHYDHRAKKAQALKSAEELVQRPPFFEIFKKCWVQDLSVFFVFFVTLTCFPAIQANIKPVDEKFWLPEKYFAPVACFLFFNTFAMFGNLFSEFVRKPGPRWVWIPVLLRGLFIPYYMFCNFKPSVRGLPVLIRNDYAYIIGGIVMAFTSGYFSSLTMMYAPGCVEPQHQAVAGMMAAFFLILGISIGIIFSIPVSIFVEQVGH